MGLVIHANQLEQEISEGGVVEDLGSRLARVRQFRWPSPYDDDDHAPHTLAASEEGGQEENDDGDGHRGDGQVEFGVIGPDDDDEELDREAEEEEEVKLQQSNVDLFA